MNMVNDPDYKGIEFFVSKNILTRLKRKIIFALMCFVTKSKFDLSCLHIKWKI